MAPTLKLLSAAAAALLLLLSPGEASAAKALRKRVARAGPPHRATTEAPANLIPFCTPDKPCKLLLVADMDSSNRRDKGSKLKFESRLMPLDLQMTFAATSVRGGSRAPEVKLVHGKQETFYTLYNEGGRGGEFSELAKWRGRLFTADDRTGIVFEFGGSDGDRFLLPRFVFNEGDGESSAKGHKIEWMATKDGDMYLGSFGKEWALPTGEIKNRNQEWVVRIDRDGRTTRLDWGPYYQKMRQTVGAEFPGYLTHESIRWSPRLGLWVALPRKVSKEQYDDEKDEHRGAKLMIFCTEHFDECFSRSVDFQNHRPELGFSSFAFVPGTDDSVIAALMSEEVGETQQTFFGVFDIWGRVYHDLSRLPTDVKYEGLTFVSAPGVKPPKTFERFEVKPAEAAEEQP